MPNDLNLQILDPHVDELDLVDVERGILRKRGNRPQGEAGYKCDNGNRFAHHILLCVRSALTAW
ncbi:MAG: hypothetical protein EBT91_05670 [Rhodobacteraceae bacterium]|nr:hypothetical protein [Paracoccaceae bacterium]